MREIVRAKFRPATDDDVTVAWDGAYSASVWQMIFVCNAVATRIRCDNHPEPLMALKSKIYVIFCPD